MKMIFKIYEHKDTLEKEFSSVEEAHSMVEKMVQENPNLLIEPYFEVDAGCVVDACEPQDDDPVDYGAWAEAF